MVNDTRLQNGQNELKTDPRLSSVAREHSLHMADKDVLASGPPTYREPFERALEKRLTDLNTEVAVAKASTLDEFKDILNSDPDIEQIISSPRMTHVGIGIASTDTGMMWLTIHMVQRIVHCKPFKMTTGPGAVQRKSITMTGETSAKTLKIGTACDGDMDSNHFEVTKIITPNSNGDFSASFDFDQGEGKYGFVFWIYENGKYRKTNYFDITVR
jgi:hypothetical protein